MGIKGSEKLYRLAGWDQSRVRMDGEEIAIATLDRLHIEDEIRVGGGATCTSRGWLSWERREKWSSFQTEWYSVQYPQPVGHRLHQQP